MKKTLITTALLALLGGGAPLAFAQADHDAHHGGASAPAEANAKLAEGTVKKIDKSAGKLTIVPESDSRPAAKTFEVKMFDAPAAPTETLPSWLV